MKNKKPAILFLTLYTFSLTGGIEKVTRAMAKVLSNLKASLMIDAFKLNAMHDEGIDDRYLSKIDFEGFSGNKLKFALLTLLNASKYDVFILSHVNLLSLAWLIKKLNAKKRVIVLAHGIEVWGDLNGWKQEFMQRHCEIWAVSKFTKDQLVKKGISDAAITVLNNCLDPYFEPTITFEKSAELLSRYGLNDQQPILFTLTRLSAAEQYKGYDQVISILNRLVAYPSLHYILAGKADDIELQRVKALIKLFGVEDQVTLTGFIKEEEINDHYNLADIFVMPSKGEGFGICFIEAAACGCISIAGNKDGSADALLNGELGSLIDPDDEEELTATIHLLLKEKRTAGDAKLLQEKCLENFGYEGYKEKLKELILEKSLSV